MRESDPPVTVTLDLRREVAWPTMPPDGAAQSRALIRAAIARAGLRGDFAVSVVITGDRQMQRINRRFRGIDRTTDVLSFPQSSGPLLALPPEERWVARPFGDDVHDQPYDADAPDDDAPAATLPFAEPDAPAESPLPGTDAADDTFLLGDIMISAPTVARQAEASGHSAWWEYCFLLVHGTLHLLGYDDYYEPGYRAMVALQEAVLADQGISR